MKVGSLVYATDSGLGILAKSFYDHGIVTDVCIVEHHHHPNHFDWYPTQSMRTPIRPIDSGLARGFCASMDVMLFFETPFDWGLVSYCREIGVKTAIMPMHECMPKVIPHFPDLWICPSKLDMVWSWNQSWSQLGKEPSKHPIFIPVPVEVTWRLRTKAEVFVHNAGHGGLKGRNGTAELLEALYLVKSPITLLLRSQGRVEHPVPPSHITLKIRDQQNLPYDQLWTEGDVFVFPERHNGLSLPLQEARAAGMLVMAGDRFPMNEWLPKEALIPVSSYNRTSIGGAYAEFDQACFTPESISTTIDAWFGKDIAAYSLSGKSWAEQNSWEALKPKYLEVLNGL